MDWRDKWLSRLVHRRAKTNLPPKAMVTDARGCKLSPHESRKELAPSHARYITFDAIEMHQMERSTGLT